MTKFTRPHIAITVNNIQETKSFYKRIGFKIKDEIYSKEKARHFLLLEGYNFEIECFRFDNQKSEKALPEDYKRVGFLHFALPTLNLKKVRDKLVKEGIKFSKDISVSSGGLKYLNIIDPSGVVIEFFETSG